MIAWRVVAGIATLAATVLTLGVLRSRSGVSRPAVHRITIEGMEFQPATLLVLPGDTVVWQNDDIFVHTVTARDSAWSSPPLAQGETWRWVARSIGRVVYHCAYHPTMEGRLIVAAGR